MVQCHTKHYKFLFLANILPSTYFTLQTDNMSCSVFICYYAYQKIQKRNLNDPFDPILFRKFIFENLILQ